MDKKRARQIQTIVRLINTNFTADDFFVTLTYSGDLEPKSEEQARRNVQNYIRRLKKYMAKGGLPELKYIYVTDRGRYCYHHLILSGEISKEKIEALWFQKHGLVMRVEHLPGDNQKIANIAAYIVKGPESGRVNCSLKRQNQEEKL